MKWNDHINQLAFEREKKYAQEAGFTEKQLNSYYLDNDEIKKGLNKYPKTINYITLAYYLGILRGIRIADEGHTPIVLDQGERIMKESTNTVTRYIVVGRYGTMLEHPEVCKTKNEAIKYIQEIMMDDLCADYDDNMRAEGIDMDNIQAILNWGKDHDYIQGDDNSYYYTSNNDWHEYIIYTVNIELD